MSDDADHPFLTLVGVVAVALGVLMVVQPGLAAAIGTGYVAVTIVGVLALVQGIRVARARKAAELRAAETPDVETVETMPTPGDDFDQEVAGLRTGPRRTLIRKRAELQETLEATAVRVVADRENCSREAARERVAAGTWTDDLHGASFLGGDDAPSPPLFDRLRIAVTGQSSHQFYIRRTADAIAGVAGVTDGSDDLDSSGESDEADGASDADESAEGGPRPSSPTAKTDDRWETDDRRESQA
jgi:hypothetical protein